MTDTILADRRVDLARRVHNLAAAVVRQHPRQPGWSVASWRLALARRIGEALDVFALDGPAARIEAEGMRRLVEPALDAVLGSFNSD